MENTKCKGVLRTHCPSFVALQGFQWRIHIINMIIIIVIIIIISFIIIYIYIYIYIYTCVYSSNGFCLRGRGLGEATLILPVRSLLIIIVVSNNNTGNNSNEHSSNNYSSSTYMRNLLGWLRLGWLNIALKWHWNSSTYIEIAYCSTHIDLTQIAVATVNQHAKNPQTNMYSCLYYIEHIVYKLYYNICIYVCVYIYIYIYISLVDSTFPGSHRWTWAFHPSK